MTTKTLSLPHQNNEDFFVLNKRQFSFAVYYRADSSSSHALSSQDEDEMEESTITSVNIKGVLESINIFVISFYI